MRISSHTFLSLLRIKLWWAHYYRSSAFCRLLFLTLVVALLSLSLSTSLLPPLFPFLFFTQVFINAHLWLWLRWKLDSQLANKKSESFHTTFRALYSNVVGVNIIAYPIETEIEMWWQIFVICILLYSIYRTAICNMRCTVCAQAYKLICYSIWINSLINIICALIFLCEAHYNTPCQ